MFSEQTTFFAKYLPLQVTQLSKENFMLANKMPCRRYHAGVSASCPMQELR